MDPLADEYRVVGVDLREPDGSDRKGVEYLAAGLTEQGPVWAIGTSVDSDVFVHLAAVPGAGHRVGTGASREVHAVRGRDSILDGEGPGDAGLVARALVA